MLKSPVLWGKVILVVAIAVGAITFTAYREHKASDKYKVACQNYISRVTAGSVNQRTSTEECQDPKEYMPWWYALIAWPDGITTWALLATLAAIIWQAVETRRAANATAEAANAAYGSVTYAQIQWKAMKEKERARLEVRAGSFKINQLAQYWHVKATIEIRNIGSGRAFIARNAGKLVASPIGSTVPDIDDFWSLSLPEPFIDPSSDPIEIPLHASPSEEHMPADLNDFTRDVLASRLTLRLIGFVEYDSVGARWRREFRYSRDLVDVTGALMGTPEPLTDKERVLRGWWMKEKDEEYEIEAN